jgi:hypothetical protein
VAETAGSRPWRGRRHDEALERFDRTQELGLHARWHLADLVEEDRSSRGGLEEPEAILVRARERPPAMAEELALEQGFGQRSAVHREERRRRAAAGVVDAARHQLLSGSGLAFDQDGEVRGARLSHQIEDLEHRRAVAEEHTLLDGGADRRARLSLPVVRTRVLSLLTKVSPEEPSAITSPGCRNVGRRRSAIQVGAVRAPRSVMTKRLSGSCRSLRGAATPRVGQFDRACSRGRGSSRREPTWRPRRGIANDQPRPFHG